MGINLDSALGEQHLGIPADAESGSKVRRSFFLRRELEPIITDIVQDGRTAYESLDDFIQHALYGLLAAYVEGGYPHMALGEELSYIRSIRTQANRARRRTEIRKSFHRFDDELETATRNGDWAYLESHLAWLEEVLRGAPSEGLRQEIRSALAQSLTLNHGVAMLVRSEGLPLEVAERAERWRGALEEWLVI